MFIKKIINTKYHKVELFILNQSNSMKILLKKLKFNLRIILLEIIKQVVEELYC